MLRERFRDTVRKVVDSIKPTFELEELLVLMEEFKGELVRELRPTVTSPPPAVAEIVKVEVPRVEVETEPLPRPFHSYGSDDILVKKPTKLFSVNGEGLLETFFVVCSKPDFKVKLVVDGVSPVAYNDRTFDEYVLISSDDAHVSADSDVVGGETVYKVSIDEIPFWKNCAGYVSPVGDSVVVKLWRANLSYVPSGVKV